MSKFLNIVENIDMKVIEKIDSGKNGYVYKILFKRNGRQFTYHYHDVRRRGASFRNVVIDLFNHTQSVTHYSIEKYMKAFGITDSNEGIKRYNQSCDITNRALAVFEDVRVLNFLVEKWQEEQWEDRYDRC